MENKVLILIILRLYELYVMEGEIIMTDSRAMKSIHTDTVMPAYLMYRMITAHMYSC